MRRAGGLVFDCFTSVPETTADSPSDSAGSATVVSLSGGSHLRQPSSMMTLPDDRKSSGPSEVATLVNTVVRVTSCAGASAPIIRQVTRSKMSRSRSVNADRSMVLRFATGRRPW